MLFLSILLFFLACGMVMNAAEDFDRRRRDRKHQEEVARDIERGRLEMKLHFGGGYEDRQARNDHN